MTLEVAHFPEGRPSSAGMRTAVQGQLAGAIPRAAWKPSTVAVTLPPWTAPTKVQLCSAALQACLCPASLVAPVHKQMPLKWVSGQPPVSPSD